MGWNGYRLGPGHYPPSARERTVNGWLLRGLAFTAGALLLQGLPVLPSPLLLAAGALLPLAVRLPGAYRPLAFLPAGFLWALLQAHLLLAAELPPVLEGRDIWLEGIVAGLPAVDERRIRFELDVIDARLAESGEAVPRLPRVRLGWYGRFGRPAPGERWRLKVRLKRPHGFRNPGGFDYEAWLFRHGIRATGYVRADPGNRRLAAARGRPVQRLRLFLRERLDDLLPAQPASALLLALVIGDRSAMDEDQWTVLRATGTNHLMAISGLHIGLLAGLGFALGRRLWCGSGRGLLWLPAPRAGVILGLLFAVIYAALAGFSVPTRRALVVTVGSLLALWRYWWVVSTQTLGLALLAVLVLDPLAVLDAGFWLSFAAVAFIFYGLSGRPGRAGRLWQALRVQWWITLGLLPLLLFLFGQASLVSPLANLVAVPVVGLLVVPLALAGAALGLAWPAGGGMLLSLAATGMGWLMQGLAWLAGWPLATWSGATAGPGAALLAVAGTLVLLAPRGLPGRLAGAVLLLPLLFPAPPRPPAGQADFTLLDVGQGLAAVVRTRNHVLLYDTGPRFGPGFEAGGAVVVPFLQARGIRRLDRLVVSHGDSDHRGGAEAVLGALPVGDFLASRELAAGGRTARACRAGEAWDWDGVHFAFVHPAGRDLGRNDASCVLQVTAGAHVLLLTGDIERPAERRLVRRLGPALRADVLVVPHHGSNSSSTDAFLDAVRPVWALYPVGYRNRFRFPDPRVVARYRSRGVHTLATDRSGAIELRLGGRHLVPVAYRERQRRYWHDGAGP